MPTDFRAGLPPIIPSTPQILKDNTLEILGMNESDQSALTKAKTILWTIMAFCWTRRPKLTNGIRLCVFIWLVAQIHFFRVIALPVAGTSISSTQKVRFFNHDITEQKGFVSFLPSFGQIKSFGLDFFDKLFLPIKDFFNLIKEQTDLDKAPFDPLRLAQDDNESVPGFEDVQAIVLQDNVEGDELPEILQQHVLSETEPQSLKSFSGSEDAEILDKAVGQKQEKNEEKMQGKGSNQNMNIHGSEISQAGEAAVGVEEKGTESQKISGSGSEEKSKTLSSKLDKQSSPKNGIVITENEYSVQSKKQELKGGTFNGRDTSEEKDRRHDGSDEVDATENSDSSRRQVIENQSPTIDMNSAIYEVAHGGAFQNGVGDGDFYTAVEIYSPSDRERDLFNRLNHGVFQNQGKKKEVLDLTLKEEPENNELLLSTGESRHHGVNPILKLSVDENAKTPRVSNGGEFLPKIVDLSESKKHFTDLPGVSGLPRVQTEPSAPKLTSYSIYLQNRKRKEGVPQLSVSNHKTIGTILNKRQRRQAAKEVAQTTQQTHDVAKVHLSKEKFGLTENQIYNKNEEESQDSGNSNIGYRRSGYKILGASGIKNDVEDFFKKVSPTAGRNDRNNLDFALNNKIQVTKTPKSNEHFREKKNREKSEKRGTISPELANVNDVMIMADDSLMGGHADYEIQEGDQESEDYAEGVDRLEFRRRRRVLDTKKNKPGFHAYTKRSQAKMGNQKTTKGPNLGQLTSAGNNALNKFILGKSSYGHKKGRMFRRSLGIGDSAPYKKPLKNDSLLDSADVVFILKNKQSSKARDLAHSEPHIGSRDQNRNQGYDTLLGKGFGFPGLGKNTRHVPGIGLPEPSKKKTTTPLSTSAYEGPLVQRMTMTPASFHHGPLHHRHHQYVKTVDLAMKHHIERNRHGAAILCFLSIALVLFVVFVLALTKTSTDSNEPRRNDSSTALYVNYPHY
ncbi:hypothetical protein PoB_001288500 [Plakobranchus ocellatus]|uniref:Uncharacterized protein n=1 Tax=Plakobranchus ocellatus TaxID=259542 RepID=A0AAV3YVB6_9GAST|nr:hypothetical protein PoB_001288500 [Plakobranchus ocellatus]